MLAASTILSGCSGNGTDTQKKTETSVEQTDQKDTDQKEKEEKGRLIFSGFSVARIGQESQKEAEGIGDQYDFRCPLFAIDNVCKWWYSISIEHTFANVHLLKGRKLWFFTKI